MLHLLSRNLTELAPIEKRSTVMKLSPVFTFIALLILTGCLQMADTEYDNTADLEFLEAYAQLEDVVITDSGLMYRILEEGEGDYPMITSSVRVHYIAQLVNGMVIDNSYEKNMPVEFSLETVIAGFAEGLMLMQEGARHELVIPTDLAYGNKPPDGSIIHPGATLIFRVELLKILSDEIDDPEL